MKRQEAVQRIQIDTFPLLLLSCGSWMSVKENPGRKKKSFQKNSYKKLAKNFLRWSTFLGELKSYSPFKVNFIARYFLQIYGILHWNISIEHPQKSVSGSKNWAVLLTHFIALVSFCSTWRHQKTFMFPGCTERESHEICLAEPGI